MATIGDGIESLAIEQDPGIAQLQAAQYGAQLQQTQVSLPATGFVAEINGEDGAITIQPGTSTAGVTVVVTNGLGTISIGVTIPVIAQLQALATIQCNFTAVVAPAVTDDSGDGYAVGSFWVDTALDDAYICCDATLGAAVWKQIT
jgi:hypothetical protein